MHPPAGKLRQGEGAESQEGHRGTPGTQNSDISALQRKVKSSIPSSWPPSPAHSRGSTAGTQHTAGNRGREFTQQAGLSPGCKWGRGEQGSHPQWVYEPQDLAGQHTGVIGTMGKLSVGGVGCPGWGTGTRRDTVTTSCLGRAPEEKEGTFPRAMGTGRAGTGLGKRKDKKEISQQEIWVKNFPREQWRRRGGGSWVRGWGTGWAGDARCSWEPSRPLTTKM